MTAILTEPVNPNKRPVTKRMCELLRNHIFLVLLLAIKEKDGAEMCVAQVL